MSTTACLNIQDGVPVATVKEIRAAVMAIITSDNAEVVKLKALEVIQTSTATAAKSVSHCNFEMKAK